MEKTVPTKKDILYKALEKVLAESSIPYEQHVKTLTALKKATDKNEQDRTEHLKTVKKMQAYIDDLHDTLSKHTEVIKHLHTIKEGPAGESIQGPAGSDGRDGKDAVVDHNLIIDKVLQLIPKPKDGAPGKDGTVAEVDKKELFGEFVGLLRKNSLLDVSHIKGLQGWMRDGIKYRFEELMHGGGSSTGGSLTVITVTGTVDDTNTSFTAATQPTLLNINGAFYKKTGGAYTWTYAGTTITLSSPVGTGGTIFGLK